MLAELTTGGQRDHGLAQGVVVTAVNRLGGSPAVWGLARGQLLSTTAVSDTESMFLHVAASRGQQQNAGNQQRDHFDHFEPDVNVVRARPRPLRPASTASDRRVSRGRTASSCTESTTATRTADHHRSGRQVERQRHQITAAPRTNSQVLRARNTSRPMPRPS